MTNTDFADRDGSIWLNGKMVPWRDAKVHVLTHALHYASCVFEGERAYNDKIFKSVEHTDRLFRSAELLGMKQVPFTKDEVNQAKVEVLRANGFTNAYLRPFIWRGSEEMGLGASHCKINVAVAAWEWPPYFSVEKLKRGLRFKFSEWRRPNPNSAPSQAKAAGLYMICTLSKHDAVANGYDDVLMLDYRGQIAESSAANIFFVKDGEIHTPAPDCFLNGITRLTVIELAKKRGIKVHERAIMPEEMAGFTECFITGTAVEIMTVGEIDKYRFNMGKVTETIIQDYHNLIGSGFKI